MVIECPIAWCELEENGAKYKIPEMEPALAMELMKIHGRRGLERCLHLGFWAL